MHIVKLDKTQMLGQFPFIQVPKDGWVAGGAIRRWFKGEEKLSDVDCFFQNKESLEHYIHVLNGMGFTEINKHQNAISYSNEEYLVQCIIVKFYKDVTELLDSFDFTLCQFAYDGKEIYASSDGIVSVLRNHLGVHKLEGNVTDSLRRAFKYTKKGYYPCNGTLQKLALALNGTTAQAINDSIEISPNGGRRIVRID
jgi:hypothetical protein